MRMGKRNKSRSSDTGVRAGSPPPQNPNPQAAQRRNMFLAIGFVALFAVALVAVFLMLPGERGSGRAVSDGSNPRCVIETSMGDITVELFAKQAPISVKNFLDYVEAKHYDGTIFHRVL